MEQNYVPVTLYIIRVTTRHKPPLNQTVCYTAGLYEVSFYIISWQAIDWCNCDSWLLCLENSDEISIFAVSKRWLLQQREAVCVILFQAALFCVVLLLLPAWRIKINITYCPVINPRGWLSSQVVSMLDSGVQGPGLNRSRDAVG